jgi:hypothetical protein
LRYSLESAVPLSTADAVALEKSHPKNNRYTSTLTAVSGTPIRANSQNVTVTPAFFSAFWMMMTLLAAPRIEAIRMADMGGWALPGIL